MDEGEDERLHDQNGARPDEHDEVLVVSLADASTKPWTVMVESLNAAIADSTVDSSRWSVDLTGRAVFDLGHAVSHDI